MDALVAPVPAVDAVAWRFALQEAKAKLAGLAVRRAGAPRFRVTDHEVRTALNTESNDPGHGEPFAWTARTARRSIGVAAVRLLAGGAARSPLEAVRSRLDESSRWVREGSSSATQLDRWVDGLSPAGRAAVGAEAVTWATRLWCALDWSSFCPAPEIGRDHWWDSPHSALLGPARPGRRAHGPRPPRRAVGAAPGLGARRARPGHPCRVPPPTGRWWPRARRGVVAGFGSPGPGGARADCPHPRSRSGGAGAGRVGDGAPIGRLKNRPEWELTQVIYRWYPHGDPR